MANNKVIDKDGNVLLDLTEDDVVEADVISGKKFHTRDGVQRTGSAVLATKTIVENGTYNASDDNASGYSSVTVNVSGDADPIKDAIDAITAIPALSWANLFYVDPSKQCLFRRMTNVKSSWFADSAQILNMESMFFGCSFLTTVPLFDTSNVWTMGNMFNKCSRLTTVPLFNTSNVTTMAGMFQDCSKLTTIPAFDASKVTTMVNIFKNCSNLEEIHMTGIKASLDIHWSTKFTREALVEILNNLATVENEPAFTMGSTNLDKLTDEDKAIATNKGWLLA